MSAALSTPLFNSTCTTRSRVPSLYNHNKGLVQTQSPSSPFDHSPPLHHKEVDRRPNGHNINSNVPSPSLAASISPVPSSIHPSVSYPPNKNRAPFRTPLSVRALQLSSPSRRIFLASSSSLLLPEEREKAENDYGDYDDNDDHDHDHDEGAIAKVTLSSDDDSSRVLELEALQQYRLQALSAQRLSPPASRSSSSRHTSSDHYKSLPVTHELHKEQYQPLILLHVTILQSAYASPSPSSSSSCSSPPLLYPLSFLKRNHAPSYAIQNTSLLRRSLTPELCSRGLLVAHPHDEFDLLEERVLESLGLIRPRLGDDGHFWGGDDAVDEKSDCNTLDNGDNKDDDAVIAALMIKEESNEAEAMEDQIVCDTCDQHLTCAPSRGFGQGKRRWDVRFYAANGLMRTGAWIAAWREMERVDVEVGVWMEDKVRLRLESAWEEDQMEEAAVKADGKKILLALEMRKTEETLERDKMEKLKEKEKAEEAEGQQRARKIDETVKQGPTKPESVEEILMAYLVTILQDVKNVALVGLVVLLALVTIFAAAKSPIIVIGDSTKLAVPYASSSAACHATMGTIAPSSISTMMRPESTVIAATIESASTAAVAGNSPAMAMLKESGEDLG